MSALDDLLSCVRKEHSYSVRQEPTKPIQIISNDDKVTIAERSTTNSTTPPTPCHVCHQHCSRYRCPRCSIPYCSLACYNSHESNGSGDCKEGFFRDRTSQHVDREAKERLDETKQLIQRIYNEQTETVDDANAAGFTQQELLQIMRCLEDGDESKIENLLESAKIRHALSDSMNRGELLDFVLDTWTPWWRPEISTRYEVLDDENNEPLTDANLDEKILKIPPMTSLHPYPHNLPDLQYNLLDILYAISWTLRLYHGSANAIEIGVDAGETLLEASSVLSNDARWENLSEVLSACAALSTRSLATNGCNASWSCLVHDVGLICGNRRYVAKAFFEAIDIMERATSASKQTQDKDATVRFRKCRKKLEFFLSWSQEPRAAQMVRVLPTRIETWSAEWQLPESDDGGFTGIRRIATPSQKNCGPISDHLSLDEGMMREVSTRKK